MCKFWAGILYSSSFSMLFALTALQVSRVEWNAVLKHRLQVHLHSLHQPISSVQTWAAFIFTLFLVSVVPPVVWHKAPASYLSDSVDFTAPTEVSAVGIMLSPRTSAFQFTGCFNCRPSNATYIHQLIYLLASRILFFIPCHVTTLLVVLMEVFGDQTFKQYPWKQLIPIGFL